MNHYTVARLVNKPLINLCYPQLEVRSRAGPCQ